jgi:predicted dehydrogenase
MIFNSALFGFIRFLFFIKLLKGGYFMDPIRVAILGQGRSGRDIHGACLINMKDKYTIAAIVDPLEGRRERGVREFGCAGFENYRQLIERKDELKLDLVINATPSPFHYSVTKELLGNGFCVLCEKPFAQTVAQVDELAGLARQNNVNLAVFQQSRFMPVFVKIRDIIASGALGRIIQVSMEWSGFSRRWDWQTLQENVAGSLYNTGPHPVDQLLRLLDYDGMPDVRCYMNRVNTWGDAEDYVKLIVTAPDKPVIDLEVSSCNAYPGCQYIIHASNGGLRADNGHIDYKYFKPEESPPQTLRREPISQPDGTPVYCRENLKWYEESWDVSDEGTDTAFDTLAHKFYCMLYGVIREGAPLEITVAQVRQQIAVIEEAHRQNPMSRLD